MPIQLSSIRWVRVIVTAVLVCILIFALLFVVVTGFIVEGWRMAPSFGDPAHAASFVGLAFAIFTATAKGRTFGEHFGIIFIVATWTIITSTLVARMLLPVATGAHGTVAILTIIARAIGLRPTTVVAIITWTLETRTLVTAAILARLALEIRTIRTRPVEAWFVKAWFVKIARRAIHTLFPRLGIAAIRPVEIATRGAVLARFVVTRLVEPGSVEISRAIARRTGVAPGMIGRTCIALLPGL